MAPWNNGNGSTVTPEQRTKPASMWSLRLDLATARALVWLASVGRDAELTPEAHAYLCDRYHRLADCYRRRGRLAAAGRAQARAEDHCGGEGPPYAAAMAMPRPRRFVVTDAVSRTHMDGPDDAA